MNILRRTAEQIIHKVSLEEGLHCDLGYCEIFPSLINDARGVELVAEAAFKWSEDLSYFSHKYAVCLFGLGAGIDQAALRHPTYDFPDNIIETGISLFYKIYEPMTLKE